MKLEHKYIEMVSAQVKENLEDDFLSAGRVLKSAQEMMPDEFRRIADAAGISLRKAYYLIQIEANFGPYELEPGRLKAIGWTKLIMIGPRLTPDNCEELLVLAEGNTAHKLSLILAGEFPAPTTRVLQIYLTPDEYETVAKALVEFGAMRVGSGLIHKEVGIVNMALRALAND